jgi:hypothetical protein
MSSAARVPPIVTINAAPNATAAAKVEFSFGIITSSFQYPRESPREHRRAENVQRRPTFLNSARAALSA